MIGVGRTAFLSIFLSTALFAHPCEGQSAPEGTTVLRASRILDGEGGVLENRDVVIRDGRIVELASLGQAEGDVVYDLTSHIHRHPRPHRVLFQARRNDPLA